MARFGFIGMGNMGYAMLNGLLTEYAPTEIAFTSPSRDKCEKISNETGAVYYESNVECANVSKYVILAVKPQMYDTVLKNIKNVVTEQKVIISIAPGISIDSLKKKLGEDIRIVRAMPNTPALVGEGMTGISYNKEEFEADEIESISRFFNSFGKVTEIPEHLMNALCCASGSSPAYVYMFIEALADSVVKYGIPRKDAYKLAAQTVLGSAKMVLETGEHPGVLKDNVCSPGGTTIQGVSALEEFGLRNAVIKATDKCYEACCKFK